MASKNNYKKPNNSNQNVNASVSVKQEAVAPVEETVVEEVVVSNEEVVESNILSEFNHQMAIFNQLIYHVRNQGAIVTVQNLGYGDVYASTKSDSKFGSAEERVNFGESKTFEDVDYLYLISASQPVISIIETK